MHVTDVLNLFDEKSLRYGNSSLRIFHYPVRSVSNLSAVFPHKYFQPRNPG